MRMGATMHATTTKKNSQMKISCVAAFVILAVLVVPRLAAQTRPPDAAREQRLAWFREAKYGLFIHWGLYAIPAGEWNGKRSPGLGEWVMFRSTVPVKEYEQLASRFNPVKFNADEWVALAKDAGMKYIVITSKHHDGFALFKSAASPYNVVDATPFKRDILKELADACARGGIRLGFYYSQSQDWHEPNGAGNTWDFGADEKKDYDQYLRGKAEPQVRELLTGYGKVALIWFDTPRMMTGDRPHRFTKIVRDLQPDTLIDGRLGADGDYVSTGDNVIPSNVSGEAWEVPATINHTWGFRTDDTDWKAPGQIAFKLVDIVSKGGNYLLNVGPTADGVIPQVSQDILRTVGRWLKVNGDAVYGAGPTPFGEELGEPSARGAKDVRGDALVYQQTQWRVTTKPGKLYFTFFDEPRAPFPLPEMKNRALRAYRLADRAPVERRYPTQFVKFADVQQDATLRFQAGKQTNQREVNILIGKNVDAGRIMAGVTFSEPGNWTSWPPHEHAAMLEEAYLYIDMPAPAYGVQLVYTNGHEPELATIVHEGDVVLMPQGYHPNVAAPGGSINFLWMMAANRERDDRQYGVVNVQPEFAAVPSGLDKGR
jgi:alpha-L-fucosidase